MSYGTTQNMIFFNPVEEKTIDNGSNFFNSEINLTRRERLLSTREAFV